MIKPNIHSTWDNIFSIIEHHKVTNKVDVIPSLVEDVLNIASPVMEGGLGATAGLAQLPIQGNNINFNFNKKSITNSLKGLLMASMIGGATLAPNIITKQAFNPEAHMTSMISNLMKRSNYPNTKEFGITHKAMENTIGINALQTKDKLKIAQNFYLLNHHDTTKPLGSYNMLKSDGTKFQRPIHGYNIVDFHAGIDVETDRNFAILQIENEVTKKLGYKKGQHLDSFELSELIQESPGYNKNLPTILLGCKLGKIQGKNTISYPEDVATFLDQRVIAADNSVWYHTETQGILGVFEENKRIKDADLTQIGNVRVYDPYREKSR